MVTEFISINRYEDGKVREFKDLVLKETIIELVVDGEYIGSIVATDMAIKELVYGHLYHRGIITQGNQVLAYTRNQGFVYVTTKKRRPIENLRPVRPVEGPDKERLLQEYKDLSHESELFTTTGAVHMGKLLNHNFNRICMMEDMGRHNVIEKIIGYTLLNPVENKEKALLMVSSRMSLELMERVCKAGFKTVAAVSAPTLEAIEKARNEKINFYAMCRGNRFNIYWENI